MSKSMSWEWREHNREKVEKALQKGEYDAILTSRESALATLAHLAWELGVLDAVKQIRVRRQRAGIPDELLLRTLAVLPFVEAVGLSAAAETLFADAAYAVLHIEELVTLLGGAPPRFPFLPGSERLPPFSLS